MSLNLSSNNNFKFLGHGIKFMIHLWFCWLWNAISKFASDAYGSWLPACEVMVVTFRFLNSIITNYTTIYKCQQPWSTDLAQPPACWDMATIIQFFILKKKKKLYHKRCEYLRHYKIIVPTKTSSTFIAY